MSKTVIKVENLGKKYIIGHQKQERYTALRDVIANGVKSILTPNSHNKNTQEEFWALNDISFEIKQGDRVGIIGRNGAGKSTLLKVLSRITEPTKGQIKIQGRVASLLEVGTGFHPELTGRENIFLNGAILGMRKAEIKKKFDEIVAFAEVEKFLDTPVKRYSSGMYVRLAFAVAAHLEPEILVVDEVLAVGDAQFQKKCLGKMEDVAEKEGRTVLFVSHQMTAVRKLCSKGILLCQGLIEKQGKTDEILDYYLQKSSGMEGNEGEIYWQDRSVAPGSEEMSLKSIRLLGANGIVQSNFDIAQTIRVEITYEVFESINQIRSIIQTLNSEGIIIFTSLHFIKEGEIIKPGVHQVICQIPSFLLNSGLFYLKIGADCPGVKKFIKGEFIQFSVENITQNSKSKYLSEILPGIVYPKLVWEG